MAESGAQVTAVEVDITDWDQQVTAFETAIAALSRIDYVFPIAGIGERRWLPDSTDGGWVKPNLVCVDTNLTGTLYTVALAIQQFRRQQKDGTGFRGKSESSSSTAMR